VGGNIGDTILGPMY